MLLAQPMRGICGTNKEIETPQNLQPLPRHRRISTQEIEHKADNMEGCNEEYNKSLLVRLSRLFFCLRHRYVHHTKRTFHKYGAAWLPPSLQSLAQSQNDFPRLGCPQVCPYGTLYNHTPCRLG